MKPSRKMLKIQVGVLQYRFPLFAPFNRLSLSQFRTLIPVMWSLTDPGVFRRRIAVFVWCFSLDGCMVRL